MPVRVAKVDPAASGVMIDSQVFSCVRPAPIGNAFSSDAAEHRIEVRFAHFECIVMDIERFSILIEVERQRLIDPKRRKKSDGLVR